MKTLPIGAAESILLPLDPYKDVSDFTLYTASNSETGGAGAAIRKLIPNSSASSNRTGASDRAYSYSDPIQLSGDPPGKFRSLICPCFGGKYFSLTLRTIENHGGRDYEKPASRYQKNKTITSDYDPIQMDSKVSRWEREKFLFTLQTYNKVLYETILLNKGEKSGLVIVAGSTSTGKSNLIRGLIHSYLSGLVTKKSRSPHLVTFEDPIEKLLYQDPETSQTCGFDYTPREKGKDVAELSETLNDCLRQTPSAVYVGETRDLSDWKELVNFAGTGHLAFTTCHAGSLTEVISTLCKAVEATTAATRSTLATRLLAAIHLRPAKAQDTDDPNNFKEAVVPALWRKTPAGINAMTSDGLSAILPNSFCDDRSSGDTRYCFGRTYFAEQLLKEVSERDQSRYRDSLLSNAVRFDLEGL
jgi:hypothetical protein